MILASVFESLATPFVLMFSIPLAAIGSFVALILTGIHSLLPYTDWVYHSDRYRGQ